MKKTYVLDTSFADNDVVITGTTLQELDAHEGDS